MNDKEIKYRFIRRKLNKNSQIIKMCLNNKMCSSFNQSTNPNERL